jgi:hypothetical protein
LLGGTPEANAREIRVAHALAGGWTAFWSFSDLNVLSRLSLIVHRGLWYALTKALRSSTTG